jgi:hypothetical protein
MPFSDADTTALQMSATDLLSMLSGLHLHRLKKIK